MIHAYISCTASSKVSWIIRHVIQFKLWILAHLIHSLRHNYQKNTTKDFFFLILSNSFTCHLQLYLGFLHAYYFFFDICSLLTLSLFPCKLFSCQFLLFSAMNALFLLFLVCLWISRFFYKIKIKSYKFVSKFIWYQIIICSL